MPTALLPRHIDFGTALEHHSRAVTRPLTSIPKRREHHGHCPCRRPPNQGRSPIRAPACLRARQDQRREMRHAEQRYTRADTGTAAIGRPPTNRSAKVEPRKTRPGPQRAVDGRPANRSRQPDRGYGWRPTDTLPGQRLPAASGVAGCAADGSVAGGRTAVVVHPTPKSTTGRLPDPLHAADRRHTHGRDAGRRSVIERPRCTRTATGPGGAARAEARCPSPRGASG
jgi:hypothetical protein